MKKPCKQCDFENAIRFGRADWRCPKCGRNLMLEIVLMSQAGIKLKSNLKGSKNRITKTIEEEKRKSFKEGQEVERQFILNILDGIDIADKEIGLTGGGTKAIRFALKNRIIS